MTTPKPMSEILKYYSEPTPEGVFRISPSSLDKFYACSEAWYRESVLEEGGFQGNTASVRGTLTHAFAEKAGLGEPVTNEDLSEMEHYINEQARESIDVDPTEIRKEYKNMGKVIYQYVKADKPFAVEEYVTLKISDSTILAGSCDAIKKNADGTFTITDYKTTSKSIASVKSSFAKDGLGMYRNQLMSYALAYSKKGYKVTGIRALYITVGRTGAMGKPTKKAPLGNPLPDIKSEVYEGYEPITQKLLDEHEKKMKDIDKILSMCKEDETLVPLFFRDNVSSFYHIKEKQVPVEEQQTAFGW